MESCVSYIDGPYYLAEMVSVIGMAGQCHAFDAIAHTIIIDVGYWSFNQARCYGIKHVITHQYQHSHVIIPRNPGAHERSYNC